MNRTKAILLHPLFLLSLLVLLCNDFYWKYEYHNWLTGKLSDAAGMIVLPVFCRALFPALSKKWILFSCAVFFLWWKSSLSQPVIHVLNDSFHLPVHRVVDDSDLLALLFLPFGLHIKPVCLPLHRIAFHFLRWSLGFVTFFSLCSTSVYRHLFQAHPSSDDIYFHESFTQKRPAAAVLQSLHAKGITYRRDSVMYYPVLNQGNLYYRLQTKADTNYKWQKVSQAADSTLYIKQEGSPYYLIPLFRTETRTLRNIRFTLSENKNRTKTKITIQMFQAEGLKGYVAWDKRTKREYKVIFEKLFSEP